MLVARESLSACRVPAARALLTHAPCSHLPDITIITPVFDPSTNAIIFFTASRGHHADIGGILPGSMPPTSVNLFEEGAEIVSFKIVDGGVFDQKKLYEYMLEKPAAYPGCSGCRNIRDVESDLKAVSGVSLISKLTPDEPSFSKLRRITRACSCSVHVCLMFVFPSLCLCWSSGR